MMVANILLHRVRPFVAPKLPSTAVPCRTRVLVVNCFHKQARLSIEPNEQGPKEALMSNLPLAISVALGAIGLTAQRANADEVISQNIPTLSPEDVEILAANSAGSGIDQAFVSLLFGVVVLLLVVVTGGVAYMNISQWLDNRQEQEDREKAVQEITSTAAAGGSKAGGDDGDEVISLKRASRVKKEKGKGFAAPEFTSRR
ncbi:hypothetical protein VOLCADRAFT_107832 [Volvox carteri f. nagariensis]|uniref:Transmembrane protein n=1 Tax=Volvox carteri f. nagariensis TaxID=3068 RepID=D8UGR0_VOLCA|nr:uncharacterized protein VOLCADRAFT_107832 [Volvox carteri f. nagariensis]EFJ41091.1 hypothetical protein VOLCADRAFT_107832 [Volvox carteri f. nagariensis]|eukprot:XP_002957854.1 hypothetical protein VOLCADRAFT_107832 [Volvox carteri f. nagariensis]